MKKTLLLSSLVLFAVFISGCYQAASNSSSFNDVPTISVQGNGSVETIPDEASAYFGVTSQENSLEKAYRDNTNKMNAIIETLKKKGVTEKDIATSSYSVSPVYPTDERGRQLPGKPIGFNVEQQLSVTLRDTSKVGVIIDAVMASGTNLFNGIDFTSSKFDELQKQAKQKAAQDAKDNATLLAQSLGVKLGRLLRAQDSMMNPYPKQRTMMSRASDVMMMAAPQIEAGSMDITASCSAEYEILQ